MSYIDDIMGFDPSSIDAFNAPESNNSFDANVYKTNPVKLSKSEDGHYRAKIRVIYNPNDPKKSIVHQATYFIKDADGSLLVRSKLGDGDKTCPLFTSWKKLWFSNDEDRKNWAKQMYDKTESDWALVQILEDENQPELVGKILAWKLPKSVFTKMMAKMKPSPESKKSPVPVMDYLVGLPLELDVTPGPDDPNAPERKQREISYDLCEFDAEYTPIIKVDGTQLFTDEELELIDSFVTARNEAVKGKSAAKREAAANQVKELTVQIRPLYEKAVEYLKENSIDLVQECGYQEWDEKTATRVQKWIDAVAKMEDPTIEVISAAAPVVAASEPETTSEGKPEADIADPDNLPF